MRKIILILCSYLHIFAWDEHLLAKPEIILGASLQADIPSVFAMRINLTDTRYENIFIVLETANYKSQTEEKVEQFDTSAGIGYIFLKNMYLDINIGGSIQTDAKANFFFYGAQVTYHLLDNILLGTRYRNYDYGRSDSIDLFIGLSL